MLKPPQFDEPQIMHIHRPVEFFFKGEGEGKGKGKGEGEGEGEGEEGGLRVGGGEPGVVGWEGCCPKFFLSFLATVRLFFLQAWHWLVARLSL